MAEVELEDNIADEPIGEDILAEISQKPIPASAPDPPKKITQAPVMVAPSENKPPTQAKPSSKPSSSKLTVPKLNAPEADVNAPQQGGMLSGLLVAAAIGAIAFL